MPAVAPGGSLLKPRFLLSHLSKDTESESDCRVPETEGPTHPLGSTFDATEDTMLDDVLKPGGGVSCADAHEIEDNGGSRPVGFELDD